MDESEEWRPIPGWEKHYEISSLGRVRSLTREITFADGRVRVFPGAVRALHQDGWGYMKVTLKGDGRQARALVHHLVALAWLGPRPDTLEVCHGDGVKTNNRPGNLRYDTRKANAADSVRHGTARRPRKLSDAAVAFIRAARGVVSGVALAEMCGTSKAHVCNIQRGNRRTL